MNQQPTLPDWLWQLFLRLRRRGFAVGPEDYESLKQALGAGFGWSSQAALRELCATLWAKSRREQEVLFTLFDQLVLTVEDWELATETVMTVGLKDRSSFLEEEQPVTPEAQQELSPKLGKQQGLPPILLEDVKVAERPFVFLPQFPLTYREVAQAWRRLRRGIRTGPATELDINGTIHRRCQLGVASEMVFRPHRRNVARLLLLVDRQGSMNPFHGFCEEICLAIQQAGRLEDTALYYFHNSPAEGADEQALDSLESQLFPSLDPIMPKIIPLTQGDLYTDPDLLSLHPLDQILEVHATAASVVVISDAGAARGQYRVLRLLDTIAFLKALRNYTDHIVWLNPLPKVDWAHSTAAYIARHIPMFPLDREGMYRAVNVLRGQNSIIEKPI